MTTENTTENTAVTAAPVKAAIFTLSGGGDTEVFLAPAEAIDWCMSVRPGIQKVTPEVQAALIPFVRPANPKYDDDDVSVDQDVQITPGSADNDAAMFLGQICHNFDTQRKALAFAADKGWDVVEEEYEGCIY